MLEVAELLQRAELLGVRFRLQEGKLKVGLPDDPEAQAAVDELRAHRDDVLRWVEERESICPMPPGVRLVRWGPKEAPVAIESCSVVVDVPLFIRTTLEQLGRALRNPKVWAGWSVPQLVERLRQVGVKVETAEPRMLKKSHNR